MSGIHGLQASIKPRLQRNGSISNYSSRQLIRQISCKLVLLQATNTTFGEFHRQQTMSKSMAAFSIEGLLGLDPKDDRASSPNDKTEQPAAAKQDSGEPKEATTNPGQSHATTDETHEETETVSDERTEQVTVELKTVHTTSVKRSSGSGSRKRKRTRPAEDVAESPAGSAGKPLKRS